MATSPTSAVESATDEASSVRVAVDSGRVSVVAERRDDIVVDGDATVSESGGRTTVIGGSAKLTVRVPKDTDVTVGTSSGRISVTGRVGDVSAMSSSGKITIDRARTVDARSTNGAIAIERVSGSARLRSTSGSIVIEECGKVDAATDTGRIKLKHVDGEVVAHCISGRIDIALTAAHDVTAETVTGRIAISTPPGVSVARTNSLDAVRHDADRADCVIHAHSVNGRVDVSTR